MQGVMFRRTADQALVQIFSEGIVCYQDQSMHYGYRING